MHIPPHLMLVGTSVLLHSCTSGVSWWVMFKRFSCVVFCYTSLLH